MIPVIRCVSFVGIGVSRRHKDLISVGVLAVAEEDEWSSTIEPGCVAEPSALWYPEWCIRQNEKCLPRVPRLLFLL